MDPVTPQQPPVAPPAYQQPNMAPPTSNNPGQTLGIIGIVLAFVGMQIVGLIFSIISFMKSKKANAPTTLGLVGIILNTVIVIIAVPILLLIVITSYNGVRERAREAQLSAKYDYSSTAKTSSFTGDAYDELIDASSKFFTYLTTRDEETNAITEKNGAVNVVLYGANGSNQKNGRFGMFMFPESTRMCLTDYEKNLSLGINFDPPNGDGNTAMIYVFDQASCVLSDKIAHYKYGDIKITPDNVAITGGSTIPEANVTVYETVAEKIKASTMVVNIRAHFIGSFADNL